jgi:hypothetical protein
MRTEARGFFDALSWRPKALTKEDVGFYRRAAAFG